MRWIAIVLYIVLAQVTLQGQSDVFNILFKQDFENTTPGQYNANEWKRDWNSPAYQNGLEKTKILLESDGNHVMQWNYPKGSVGPSAGGAQWEAPFAGQDEVYMSYKIRFKPGFNWVEGGKLPGPGGGPAYGSGTPMEWDEGFTARLMWRFGENAGKVMFYAYYQDKPGLYGAGHPWSNYVLKTDPERWYTITIRIVMNSFDQNKLVSDPHHAGNHDGLMEGFIDGVLMTSVTGICFANLPSIKVDKMHITSFFGGNGSNYAAARDEWNLLDDVYVFNYAPGVNVPRGHTPSPKGRVLQLPNLEQSISVPVTDTQAPSVPKGLFADEVTENRFHLKWNPSSDNTGVTGYHVYIDGKDAGKSSGTAYTVTNLIGGTKYSVCLSAYDAASNESQKSTPIVIQTIGESNADLQSPSVPGGLVLNGKTESSVSMSWSPSTDNVGVSGYIIFLNGTVKGTSTGTSYRINDLRSNTSYALTVSAYDASSNKSLPSQALMVTTENSAASGDPGDKSKGETALPKVSIIEVHNETDNRAQTISEISSYGNAELFNFGLMISKNEDPEIGGSVFNAIAGNYYVRNDGRVTKDLKVLYNFSEGKGSVIRDLSRSKTPLNLNIRNLSGITWLPGQGLKVTGNTVISSAAAPAGLLESLASTGEVTLEAWIKPAETAQEGPANIISLSTDSYNGAASLAQNGGSEGYDFHVSLMTTSTNGTGLPECFTTDKLEDIALQHVIYTRDNQGNEKIYINGIERYSGIRTGDFSSWTNNYKLVLANELAGSRSWTGTYFLVALYNRALNDGEVEQNYKAGFGKLQFNSILNNLEPATHYFMKAFARTDAGIHYGEVVDFETVQNKVTEADSIQMKVYPNPSDGVFRVSFRYTQVEYATLNISDMSGKLVYSEVIPVNTYGLPEEKEFYMTNKLKNGIYFVTLILGETTSTKKLIIQK